jgi:hypothetical protein
MRERGQYDEDDQDQPGDEQQGPYEPTRSRSGTQQPRWGTEQPQWVQQPKQAPQSDRPGWQAPQSDRPGWQAPRAADKPKKSGAKVGYGCLTVVAAVVVVLIAVAVDSGGKSANAGSATPVTTTTTAASAGAAAGGNTAAAVPAGTVAAQPASQAPAVPDQVVFSCTGSAPDGLSITYGPEGTQDSGSSLPFKQALPLGSSAQYYSVTAQLQGAGQITCTTTVDSDGQSTTQIGSANGGYNIASAEVCSDFSGGWQQC